MIKFITACLILVLFLVGCSKDSNLRIGIHGVSAKEVMYNFEKSEETFHDISNYTVCLNNNKFFYDFLFRDLSNVDLTPLSLDELANSTFFNSNTKWPLNENVFDLVKFTNNASGPPFDIEIFHSNKIEGQGIGIAVIGPLLYTKHPEYKNNLKMYYSYINPIRENPIETVLTSALISNLVGNSIGYVPKASIYYFANDGRDENGNRDLSLIINKNFIDS